MTTNLNANPLIERLMTNLAVKTDAALSKLDLLESEIAAAINEAEKVAEERINARLVTLDGDLARRVSGFEHRLAEMASNAFDAALGNLERRVDELAHGLHVNGKRVESDEDRYIPTPAALEAEQDAMSAIDHERQAQRTTALAGGITEPIDINDDNEHMPVDFDAEARDFADEREADEIMNLEKESIDEFAAVCRESAGSLSAAQVVEMERPGTLPVDDEDDDPEEDESDEDEVARAIPYTSDPAGLHTRHETGGRRARYEPVEFPEPGQTYWLRDGRRHWNAVIFHTG